MASAFAQVKDRVPDPRSIKRDMPVQLSSIVVKCLQKDPTSRYATARELAIALDECTAPTTSKPPNRRRRIKEKDFYDTLASKDAHIAAELRNFLEKTKSLGLSVDRGDNSLILKFKTDPSLELNFGIFGTDGSFLNRRIASFTERIGHPQVGETYLARLASLIPGGYVAKPEHNWAWTVKKDDNRHVTITDVLTVKDEWLLLILQTRDLLLRAKDEGIIPLSPQSELEMGTVDLSENQLELGDDLRPNIAPGTLGTENLYRGILRTAAGWLKKNEAVAKVVYNKIVASGAAGISGEQLANHREQQAAYRLAIVGKIKADTLDKDVQPRTRHYSV